MEHFPIEELKPLNPNTDQPVSLSDNLLNSYAPARRYALDPIAHLPPAQQKLFYQFGLGEPVSPSHHLIHRAFEQQVLRQPDAIAVLHNGQSLSYQQLDNQANALAAILFRQGVRRGDVVGLFLERSVEMLVGILAVLKLGACYVPQHASVIPINQLQHIVEVAGIDVVLTVCRYDNLRQLKGISACLSIDALLSDTDSDTTSLPSIEQSSSDRCFILFTSGTTGQPNGVQVTHQNLCNIILTAPGNLAVKPGTRVGQILSISFDMAAWEVFCCLCHGGTLVVRGDSIEQTAQQVDVLIATPSILSTLDYQRCRNIKLVAVAGEPCPKSLADRWAAFSIFYNACGPTETTIINTAKQYRGAGDQLTIGKPTPNNSVYILDENRRPCRIGDVGEMWAGGVCVSSGYLGNDLLNEERYVDDPFFGNGSKMFRTRDLARWNEDGELEHFGRSDDQVKVRGFRVELDSVSVVLQSAAGCQGAVTLRFDHRHLMAFVTPLSIDVDQLRQQVQQKLPYYCMPLHIFRLAELPLTPRGKVDKAALQSFAKETLAQSSAAGESQ